MPNKPAVIQSIKEELASALAELNKSKAQYKEILFSQPSRSTESLKICRIAHKNADALYPVTIAG